MRKRLVPRAGLEPAISIRGSVLSRLTLPICPPGDVRKLWQDLLAFNHNVLTFVERSYKTWEARLEKNRVPSHKM